MASSVSVLCPNGHRQLVKITPNTKLLQVLEEVCQKKGYSPPEEYQLKHGRTILDLTLSFRYSNLSNNAKLELVKASKARSETTVTIALQLENGSRLIKEYSPGITLWNLLEKAEDAPDRPYRGELATNKTEESTTLHPVCIYMQEEVVGETALKNVTLKHLGLTSGKAIIRLVHRAVDENVLQEIKDKIDKENTRLSKLEKNVSKEKNINQVEKTSIPPQSKIPDILPSHSNDKDNTEMEVDEKPDVQSTKNIEHAGVDRDRPKQDAVSTSHVTYGGGVAIAPGVTMYRPDQPIEIQGLSHDQQQMVMSLGAALAPQVSAAMSGTRSRQPQQQRPFADFKFPESSKGKDVYRNELSELHKEDYKPCDREAIVFSLDEPTSPELMATDEELPDGFFEVTEKDLQKMIDDLHKNINQETNQPLMTKAMKQAQMEEKFSKYERAVIRIQFPDRMVLQGMFRPRETVYALTKFVKSSLKDKSMPFYLYTTPPRVLLDDQAKTLIQAQLVPLAVVHFGSQVQTEHYLSSEVLKTVSSQVEAEKVAIKSQAKHIKLETKPYTAPTTSTKSEQTSTSNSNSNDSSDRHNSSSRKSEGGDKVPKWLKLGKK